MKILWIVNTIFPYPAEQLKIQQCAFGGWLNGLAEQLKNQKDIELGIATVYNGNELKEYYDGRVKYYLIPCINTLKYNKKMEIYWKEISQEFKPDLVHLHGTEYAHGLAFLKACPNIKVLTSIQGLVYRYADVYFGNIDYRSINKNITLRDILKNDTIYNQKIKFEIRGKNEKEIIKKSNAILGRTTWDYANARDINKNLKYYISNEILRESFYNDKWNPEYMERHSIFVSQGSYPIKGLHYMLETLSILKNTYPDVKLYVGGTNIINTNSFVSKLKLSGYGKYIISLINKLNIKDNVVFTGILNEEEVKERIVRSNVFVLPSAIENSSNSLGEAMILGMPCVASNTGGTMDMLVHKKEGFLYPYTEPAMCAEYIKKFFEDDELCEIYGEAARKTALERHDPEKIVKELIEIYKKTIKSKEL